MIHMKQKGDTPPEGTAGEGGSRVMFNGRSVPGLAHTVVGWAGRKRKT